MEVIIDHGDSALRNLSDDLDVLFDGGYIRDNKLGAVDFSFQEITNFFFDIFVQFLVVNCPFFSIEPFLGYQKLITVVLLAFLLFEVLLEHY